MTETEHAQWIRQFWKDKLDEIKGVDRMSNEYLDIAMEKVIKQEVNKVLDKIRAEAVSLKISYTDHDKHTYRRGINDVLKIIEKYKVGK